jgi:hypothetical protein
MRNSLFISIAISSIMGGICFFIKDSCGKSNNINTAYNTTLETLSVFSLTFLGFIITSFTVLQILQSKSWFEEIKTTDAFGELLNAFKLLIIISACGIFIALALRISISILDYKYIKITGVWISSFIIAFLCSFAWKTVSAIIGLFKI